MTKEVPTPIVAIVGVTVWLFIVVPMLIVIVLAEAGRRTVRAAHRTVRRIRARFRDLALWSLTSVTALATAGGLMILGGCAPELQRTHHVRIDDNGNLATLSCTGPCFDLEFDEIVPASAQ